MIILFWEVITLVIIKLFSNEIILVIMVLFCNDIILIIMMLFCNDIILVIMVLFCLVCLCSSGCSGFVSLSSGWSQGWSKVCDEQKEETREQRRTWWGKRWRGWGRWRWWLQNIKTSKKLLIHLPGFGLDGDGARSLADRPCVGICHYQKVRGIVVDKEVVARMNRRKPCVGLCYINKKRRLEQLERKKKDMIENTEENA